MRMTFEPTRLEKPGDSLEREVASVAILRGRLDQLRSRAANEDTDDGDEGAESEEAKHAEKVLDAYSEWLADTSKDFTVERRDGEVRRRTAFGGRSLTRSRARCRTL